MIELLFFLICFGASAVGLVCGIGGGVIIKPLLDIFGIYDTATISFLSGTTVLSMTTYSLINSRCSGESQIDTKIGFPLAIGAAIGGLVGKELFSYLKAVSESDSRVGQIQAACLLVVTTGALVYTIEKKRIKTRQITDIIFGVLIGLVLGILSAFLGIGGGPINLVVLFYFFSMNMKMAAENSLYIIFFSQLTSLLSSIVRRNVPAFGMEILMCMVAGGIAGGIYGRLWNMKLQEKAVNKLFVGLMLVIICINLYNIF